MSVNLIFTQSWNLLLWWVMMAGWFILILTMPGWPGKPSGSGMERPYHAWWWWWWWWWRWWWWLSGGPSGSGLERPDQACEANCWDDHLSLADSGEVASDGLLIWWKTETNSGELFPGLWGALDRPQCKLSGKPEKGIQPQHEGGETLKIFGSQ